MSDPQNRRLQTIALMGSYVPRQCGIATFTKDLRDAIASELGQRETTVIALDDMAADYTYPAEVRTQISQHKHAQYINAADLLNMNQIDAVLIQHEFGIFGGRDGSLVLDFARRLRMPLITTLHTVLAEPSTSQRAVMRELIRVSDRLVVMSHRGEEMLRDIYSVPANKIAFIPHGIPDVPFVDPSFFRDQFNIEGRRALLTFGLIGAGKGIEVAIRAMPKIVEKHPDAIYMILGATHPNLLRNEGNAYRNSLERLVDQLDLNEHVVFHNRYVTTEELLRYISVADVYLMTYPNRSQITSGTLAYAVGAGKPVVSTPFWHAEELLGNGCGKLVPFGDSDAIADAVNDLLSNETERHAMRKRAYLSGRSMIWSEVAKSYIRLASEVLAERRRRPRAILAPRAETIDISSTPDVDLRHMLRLTDDTGILQHAIHSTPDRNHGYCVDDNARALIVALMHYELSRDPSALAAADTYLAFVHHAFNRDVQRFRNFLSYDRRWLEDVGSEDSHGRSLWALGTAVQLAPNDSVLAMSTRLFQESAPTASQFSSPRAWAFSIIGLHRYLTRFSGDTHSRRLREEVAQRIMDRFVSESTQEWPWFEPTVTYANAKLPHALILAGTAAEDPAMLKQGLEALEWLVHNQLVAGRISLIGNGGWLTRDGSRARFDQQPIEAMALVEACAEAYRVTAEEKWFDHTRACFSWFLGNNDLQAAVYDAQTGGCCDGLHAGGPNQNQGAESTLSWLISLLTVTELNRTRALMKPDASTPEPSGGSGASTDVLDAVLP